MPPLPPAPDIHVFTRALSLLPSRRPMPSASSSRILSHPSPLLRSQATLMPSEGVWDSGPPSPTSRCGRATAPLRRSRRTCRRIGHRSSTSSELRATAERRLGRNLERVVRRVWMNGGRLRMFRLMSDRASWWESSLSPQNSHSHKNGSFIAPSIQNQGQQVYYGYNVKDPVQSFPRGLRMIAGKPYARGPVSWGVSVRGTSLAHTSFAPLPRPPVTPPIQLLSLLRTSQT